MSQQERKAVHLEKSPGARVQWSELLWESTNFALASSWRGGHGGLEPSLFPPETKCFRHMDISTKSTTWSCQALPNSSIWFTAWKAQLVCIRLCVRIGWALLHMLEKLALLYGSIGCSFSFISFELAVVQSVSCVWLFATPWTAALQASLSVTVSRSLLKLMSIESVMPSNHLILCHPLLLLPSIFPSIRVFSNELVLHIRWPKYWSVSFSISPFNEYSGLTYFRIEWFDLLVVQGTLKSLLQHHNSKASVLWLLAFFMVQLYIHTWPLKKP